MHTQMKWGAMYGRLEEGDTLSLSSVPLGEYLIRPGDRIRRTGRKKRSMFEMQDGYNLRYAGMVDGHLLFSSEPTGCDGNPWYYAFMYVDATTLLIGSAKGCMDIRVDHLEVIKDE